MSQNGEIYLSHQQFKVNIHMKGEKRGKPKRLYSRTNLQPKKNKQHIKSNAQLIHLEKEKSTTRKKDLL